ncbi:hypothetical protein ALC56_01947 [Trachymyrmex septentrionalis]|uniref:Uncharacterized protein n=1 Tax=Trachymyrmex septentrionalis TaxID=34720 RepID=A0A195FSX0_9HYME|nr:hypothetical protein ALC56_01947 [Trachymyrmex septentrionalis]
MLVVAIPQVVLNSVKRTWMYEPEPEDPPISRDREYRSRTQNRNGFDNAWSRTVYRLPAVPAGSSMYVLQAQACAAPGRRHSIFSSTFVEDHVIPAVIAGIGENNRVVPDTVWVNRRSARTRPQLRSSEPMESLRTLSPPETSEW